MEKQAAAQILSRVLADTAVLTVKTQNVHWHVSGLDFYGVHKLTEEQYGGLFAAQDELAERIRSLGQMAPATMAGYLKLARMQEGASGDAGAMVAELASAHESMAKDLQQDISSLEKMGDLGSQDILIRRIQEHDKAAWVLRSVLAPAAQAVRPAVASAPAKTEPEVTKVPVAETKKAVKPEKKKAKKPKKEKPQPAAKPKPAPAPVRETPVVASSNGSGRRRLFGVKADG